MTFFNVNTIFSPKADYFAHTTSDGCLKIWETSSDILKQEYTPSAHLSSTCSALAWGPYQQISALKGKRMKKGNYYTSIANLNLIAMGTLSGEVLLYSVANGDLYTKLDGGHTGVVNGISWFAEDDSLFTCSSDQHIVHWGISKGKITSKWEAGKSPIYSVCAVDSETLLSASNAIVWWNFKTQTILKKFIGHGSEVFCLIPVSLEEGSSRCKYFLSAAVGDRVVNVWHLNKDKDGSAIASFTVPDEPATLDVSGNSTKTEPIVVSVVTKSGSLNIFEHQLNGRVKKPLCPKTFVQIASKTNASEKKSRPIPILGASLTEDPGFCLLVYGDILKPVFERVELSSLQPETYLIREGSKPSVSVVEGVSKIKQPERPSDVKHLAPGYMTASKPAENVKRKKKRKDSESELPMEERLSVMYLDQDDISQQLPNTPAQSDSMVHLLLQALQSKDEKLLNTVFRCSDEHVIDITIKRLPLNSIPILLRVLHQRLMKKELGNRPCLKWLKGLLAVHLSYLMSLQEIDEYIGPISQLIETREETYPKMSQFVGLMGILLRQIDSKSQWSSQVSTEPQIVYEVESSSEENDLEEDEMDQTSLHSDGNAESSSSSSSEDEDDNLLIASDSDDDDKEA